MKPLSREPHKDFRYSQLSINIYVCKHTGCLSGIQSNKCTTLNSYKLHHLT